jgi:hypothetical protein
MVGTERDSDACSDVADGPVNHERLGDRADDPPGRSHRTIGIGVGQNGNEFVPTDPSDRVGAAERDAQPRPNVAEHAIADVVPESVIDRLEPVEVDHQDSAPDLALGRVTQGLCETIFQQEPVRKPRERVVHRLMLEGRGSGTQLTDPLEAGPERVFRLLALGDVSREAPEHRSPGLIGHASCDQVEPPGAPIDGPRTELELAVGIPSQRIAEVGERIHEVPSQASVGWPRTSSMLRVTKVTPKPSGSTCHMKACRNPARGRRSESRTGAWAGGIASGPSISRTASRRPTPLLSSVRVDDLIDGRGAFL